MPGRPARMIRSDRCRPPILALRLSSPVVMPETWPPELSARSAVLHRLGRGLEEGLDRALLAAFFRHLVERDFGLLDLRLGIDLVGGVHRALDHAAPDADQRTQQREIVDLRGEVLARRSAPRPIR